MEEDAARALADAEEQIEVWLCELDATWTRLLADARLQAAEIVADAERRATELLAKADEDAQSLLLGAGRLASKQLQEAQHEIAMARSLVVESSATLAHAADAAAAGVQVGDLAALGSAVTRLRAELSRVVDAAFDALPAVEAIAAALHLDAPEPEPEATELAPVSPRAKRGFVRRLLRI